MILAATLVILALVGSLPSPELIDDLDQAGDAEFAARQLVVCWSPDGVAAHVTDVEQSDGMTMVSGPGGLYAIGEGKVIQKGADGIRYLEMSPTADWRLWDGYVVRDGANQAGPPYGRIVEILDGASIRARFVLDDTTAAPLTTEIFNGDGALYRYSSLIAVAPREGEPMLDMSDMPEPEQRSPAVAATLPAAAGHYWAADSYAAPGGVQVFFTDGLFRFSVFEVSRKSDGGGLADADSVTIAGRGGYHRAYSPGAVSVFWKTADRAYVLVGDLPPDHLEQVLADLPIPNRPNLLKRAWRWVFG
ncbi:MAG: hypothetical protein HKO63_06415 [Acidimicrobiia bacterium]|nr:hypothetical protein [Acidimicrobiia bacterium]MBT8192185.1 hypothetical protein [Acidimicrobiia bacterium]NNL13391.1 hypothetical protein [Acidimicrobiia bacterium]NNL97822.1 hypothetical protein [Acidimicrobiia bacterium]